MANKKQFNKNKSKGEYRSHKNNYSKSNEGERYSSDVACVTKPSVHNDLDWYVHTAEEAVQIGSIPFSAAIGVDTDYNGSRLSVPGIMRLETTPIYGESFSANDAMNVAARSVYAQNRKVNSGAANYTATAYSFYLFTFDSIYYLVNHVKRAMATFNTYATFNRYLPKVMLNIMGFNYESMANNYPGHVARLNQIIRRAAVFNVPATFPIFKRHAFLFSNIISDSRGKQTQYYVHVPMAYYEYEDVSSVGDGSRLKFHRLDEAYSKTDAGKDIDWWLDLIDGLLNKAYESSTFQIMNGDTNKAFGDNVYKLNLFDANETVAITDDEMVKTQIMNATLVGAVSDADVYETLDAIDGDFILRHRPKVTNFPKIDGENLAPTSFDDHIINMYMDPSPANVIEATRNTVAIHRTENGVLPTLGNKSDVIERASIFTHYNDDIQRNSYVFANVNSTAVDGILLTGMFDKITRISAFDYAPSCILLWTEAPNQTQDENIYYAASTPMVRFDNWTILNKSQLEIIDNIAIQKLFGF